MTWYLAAAAVMDFHTVLICGGVFAVSAIVVYLISVFGMRERTYEEAMEEQRRRTQDSVPHSKSDKNRKDKKFKKWNKKMKEKVDEEKNNNVKNDRNVSDEAENKTDGEGNAGSDSKASRKKIRQRKLAGSGENIQQISSSDETDEPTFNSSVEAVTPLEEKLMIEKLSKLKEEPKLKFKDAGTDILEELTDKNESNDIPKPIRKSPSKKSKKNKIVNIDLADLSDWNESRIQSILKSSSLHDEDIQHILDAFNAKQKTNEKRKSDIAHLKKQMRETDDCLKSEQKQHQSANDKIHDLTQELNDEKAQWALAEKRLREALHQEQQEIKALHGMMQRKREQHTTELTQAQSRMQQMKCRMKEEHASTLQRLQEENAQLQTLSRLESDKQQRSNIEVQRLQHEVEQLRSSRDKFDAVQVAMQQSQEDLHRQIQQLEKHIEQMLASHKEEEYSYKQKINEMSNKMQQTENSRSNLMQEFQNTKSVCSNMETENSTLRQRLEEKSHKLNVSEQELLQLESRLDESGRKSRDLANCLEKMRAEVMELSKFKHEQVELIKSLKQENAILIAQQAQKLAELGEAKETESLEKKTVIDMQELEAIVQEKETVIQNVRQELESFKVQATKLTSDLDDQTKKEKELSNKNQELVNTLHSMDKKLQEVIKSAEQKVQEAQSKAESSSKEMQNLLNMQIKEVEAALRESFSKELEVAQEEKNRTKKDMEESMEKVENEANVRLEEFQESMYSRLAQLNQEYEVKVNLTLEEKEEISKKLDQVTSSIKDFLQNTFPSLNVPDLINQEISWNQYEVELKSYLSKFKSHDSKDLENMRNQLNVVLEEKLDLESKVSGYTNMLAETDFELKRLENCAKEKEDNWRTELRDKDELLSKITQENNDLKIESDNLKVKLQHLQGLEEGLIEIENLKTKLQTEERERQSLLQRMEKNDPSLQDNQNAFSNPENNVQVSEDDSNFTWTKTEKKKKSKKKAAASAIKK